MKGLLPWALAASLAFVQAGAQPARSIEDLLSQMTLEQKMGLVSGTGAQDPAIPPRVAGAAGSTLPLPDFGVPQITLADGPAGVRIAPAREGSDKTYYATAFPIATALTSTWDVELLRQLGEAMGNEAKEYGVDLLLGPAMNIHRNPLTGRNFEYFTEDPYLNGHVAAALVNGVQSTGVGATLKHFVANNQETNRFLLDTLVDERALREIYLQGFEIAVRRAHPSAIMAAYNKVNGQYSSQSHDLLTRILRDEWGFEGLVMTDWFGGNDAIEQIAAGTDLLMPGTEQQATQLRDEFKERLDPAALDRAVRKVLAAVFSSPTYGNYAFSDAPDLAASAKIARHAAAESVVLLKNNNGTLPLVAGELSIAAFGNASYDLISGGSGSGDVNEAYTVSLAAGLRAQTFQIDAELESVYQSHIERRYRELPVPQSIFEPVLRPEELPLSSELIKRKAREAGVAIVAIGRNSGEFADRKLEDDFNLSAEELRLIRTVAAAFHTEGKRVIAVLNIGNVVEMDSWRDAVDAIVVPWQGGQEAGHGLADVLSGRVTPSGKLATTIPLRYSDVASAQNFPGESTDEEPVQDGWSRFSIGQPSAVDYAEGIYVGYRHHDAFNVPVAYEFGFGLSYTEFSYGEVRLSESNFDSSLTVSIELSNSGSVAGKEVAQLYLRAPASRLDKPPRELKGFAKTQLLQSGETQTLTFELDSRSLASFDSDRSAWVAEAGDYTVEIGASSRDLRSRARFTLAAEIALPVERALVRR